MRRALLFLAAFALGCSSTTAGAPTGRPTVIVEGIHCYILQQVLFEKDSAEVASESAGVLESLATAMRSDPGNFVLVELAGHASADESDGVDLARRRATAVRAALVGLGVEASRMRAAGYGSHCSMRERADEAPGRDRRVETKVVRTKLGESGVELGCSAARAAGLP